MRGAVLRPGFIQPLHGITSKTKLYRAIYAIVGPLYPVFKALAPSLVTSTERLGRAMLLIARRGAAKTVLEMRDLNEVLERG